MEKSQKTQKSRWTLAVAVLLVVALGGLGAWAGLGDRSAEADLRPTYTVERAPLTISITESGSIQAREQIVIKSQVEGNATILYLVDEGTRVEAGDLLIELDASALENDLVEQQIKLQNAEAAFIRARENLAVVKNQATADVAQAELDLRFAKQDLKKYSDGEYPNQLRAAESKIALAEAELKRADEKLRWSKVLSDEKYVSKTELEADQLAQRKAQLDLELAQQDLALIKEYTHTRRLAELESAVTQADLALERTNRKASADVVQAEVELKAKEAELGQQETRLAKIRSQIEKTRITAPRAGMVVYSTSTQVSWRGNSDPLEEGQQVRERQELIYLPTADQMKAELSIHEADLDKVELGMPVRITVDALPGRSWRGRVSRIAPLPDATSMFMNPDLKVYSTDVEIDSSDGALRSGMSCQATIIAATHQDALAVPVQAVLRRGEQPTVYVKAGREFQPRAVEIGLDNKRLVRITDGLKPGDQVLLTPPLAAAQALDVESPAEDQALPIGETEAAAPSDEAPEAAAEQDEPTAEQREAMRKRLENMSPEERQSLRQQRSSGGGGGGGHP